MARKSCAQCKEPSPAGAMYYSVCGTRFPSGKKPGKPLPGLFKECPRCFANLEAYDAWCYKCGLRIEDVEEHTEVYEDPETARIYSYRFLRRARWVCVSIVLGAGLISYAMWQGWVDERLAGIFTWQMLALILSWEIFLYAFNFHLMVRLKPSSERMYDFHRMVAPWIRATGPWMKQVADALGFITGRISGRQYDEQLAKAQNTEASLKERIKALENEIRMKGEGVKVIRPPPRRDGGKE